MWQKQAFIKTICSISNRWLLEVIPQHFLPFYCLPFRGKKNSVVRLRLWMRGLRSREVKWLSPSPQVNQTHSQPRIQNSDLRFYAKISLGAHFLSHLHKSSTFFFPKLVLRKPLFKQRKLPLPSVALVLFHKPNSFTSTRRLAIFPSVEPFSKEVVTFASRCNGNG